jgi:hypothetical protein
VTGKGVIGTGDAEPLARQLESFVLIVFPAWKETLSERQLREMGASPTRPPCKSLHKPREPDSLAEGRGFEPLVPLTTETLFRRPYSTFPSCTPCEERSLRPEGTGQARRFPY